MAEICVPITQKLLMVHSSFKQIIIRTPVISFNSCITSVSIYFKFKMLLQTPFGNSGFKKIPCYKVKDMIKSVLSISVMLASNYLQCQFGVLVPRMPTWLALECPSLQKLQKVAYSCEGGQPQRRGDGHGDL